MFRPPTVFVYYVHVLNLSIFCIAWAGKNWRHGHNTRDRRLRDLVPMASLAGFAVRAAVRLRLPLLLCSVLLCWFDTLILRTHIRHITHAAHVEAS